MKSCLDHRDHGISKKLNEYNDSTVGSTHLQHSRVQHYFIYFFMHILRPLSNDLASVDGAEQLCEGLAEGLYTPSYKASADIGRLRADHSSMRSIP